MNTGTIIRDQLFALDRNEVMCWGSHNFRAIAGNKKNDGSLVFDIQNTRQVKKGTVYITLNFKDLYDIRVIDMGFNQIGITENVYVDSLIETIHYMIDRE